MFRILRLTGAMILFIVVCFIGGYPVYIPMTCLLAIYLVLELVSLCVEAEIRMRHGLAREGAERQYYIGRENVKAGFRWPWCLLHYRILRRLSLWMYFW